MDFIGRKEELNQLNSLYALPHFGLGMIYGRRRVGKTELVLESLRRSPLKSLYFQCKRTSEKDNAESLSLLAASSLFPELPQSGSIEALLRYFFVKGKDTPFVLVLDEYPYLKEKVPGIDGILQSLIQSYKEKSQLKLVLLGSYISSMKATIGMSNGPLRGRADLVIDLLALNYRESALFLKNYTPEEAFFVYAYFGGIPYYLESLDLTKGPEANLIALTIGERAKFAKEADFVLSEIAGEDSAREVFQAIAAGQHRFGDILSHTAFKSSSSLSWSLKELEEMELISREIPLNERQDSHKAIYRIKDPFLAFYFSFIFPNLSSMAVLNETAFFEHFVRDSFYASFLPRAYENLAREFLSLANRAGKFQPPFLELGSGIFHDKISKINGEFDGIAKREDGLVYFECKYEKNPLTLAEMKHLESQLKVCSLPYANLGFFAKAAFEEDALRYAQQKGYFLYTLNDCYR
jgi:AAA+ ATPase superfamily predicted ATPase